MLVRGVLLFSVVVWLPYGIYCFFVPEVLEEGAGLVARTPTAMTEVRAMYGGLQIAIGGLALAALLRPRLAAGVLLTLAFLTGGLGTTRALGAIVDGAWSAYTLGALGFEFVACALAVAASKKQARTPA